MKLDIDSYKAWAGKDHKPESDFLASIKAVPGVSAVETQTYTLETLWVITELFMHMSYI